jgi:hypothetical protein
MGPVFPVPYDFDWTGLVDPPYAVPHPMIPIRRVRDRYFWGLCRFEEELAPVFESFNQNRDSIYALFENEPRLRERYRKRTTEYLDDFFEIINEPGRVRSRILRTCRQL